MHDEYDSESLTLTPCNDEDDGVIDLEEEIMN